MILWRFFQSHKWEVIGLFLLLFSIYINAFPQGHTVLGGDIVQAIRMSENFIGIHYDDFGRNSLFYGVFYILDSFRIDDTAQLSWYLGIFLIGSYFSFLVFCTLLFPKVAGVVKTLVALFYSTNIYTLYIFTATWGYSSYQIIYIFIPALTGLYIQALLTKRPLFLTLFFLVVFLSSTSFGNPAFALSLGIYFLLLTIFLFLFRFILFDKEALKRIVWIAVGSFLLNAYWMLPLFPQMRSGIQEVFSSEVVNLTERLQKTSNAILDTIRLMPTSEQKRYFPVNFPYSTFSWMKKYIILLAFIPFFIVVAGYTQKMARRERRLYGIFLALFVVFIALVARVRFPFDTMNSFLFQLPGLNTLRGWDKLATFTPFILSVLLFLSLLWAYEKKYSRAVLLGFFLLTVALSLPFYAGGLQTKMSYILSTQKKKDFHEARWSAIVKIPDPYYAVAPVIEADHGDYKIAMLPYSPGSSIGRVSLPAWKVNGPHIARFLYSKSYIELTAPYISGWKFAEDFENSQYEDPQWIIDLYGLLGVKYVFYHKDAKLSSIEKMEASRQYMESVGAIRRMDDNQSFTLYQLNDNRIFPYVYMSGKQDVFIKPSPKGLSEKIRDMHKYISAIRYDLRNPKKIWVDVDEVKNRGHLFLNERYDSLWKAEYISEEGSHAALKRDKSVKYANAWKINENFAQGKIEIYYSPLRLFYVGQWVSGITFSLVLFGLGYAVRKKNNSQTG